MCPGSRSLCSLDRDDEGKPVPDGQISEFAVKPVLRKYSACPVGQINGVTPRVSPDKRGGSRSSRTCGGMRWTRKLRLTSVAQADGEVRWSWRPTLAPT